SQAEIGGTGGFAANRIAFNAGTGVQVMLASTRVHIVGNEIFGNGLRGIDLSSATVDGVTANDLDDPDTGTNDFQNFPVITAATANGSGTNVFGSLNSIPGQQFALHFYSNAACDDSGNGEGEVYLGTTMVLTNSGGDTTFTVFG